MCCMKHPQFVCVFYEYVVFIGFNLEFGLSNYDVGRLDRKQLASNSNLFQKFFLTNRSIISMPNFTDKKSEDIGILFRASKE